MSRSFKNNDSGTRTGLFFGSFNPIHIGHLTIARYFLEFTDLKQVWFVISPHNPLKKKESLLADHHRLNMVKLAIEDTPALRACDIEFKLSQPSYTIHTLTYLKEKYPGKKFVLIMGGDNLETLHKWKNFELILQDYEIYVYVRPGATKPAVEHEHIRIFDAPLMDISSSFIRQALKDKKDVSFLLPPAVARYIDDMMLYRST